MEKGTQYRHKLFVWLESFIHSFFGSIFDKRFLVLLRLFAKCSFVWSQNDVDAVPCGWVCLQLGLTENSTFKLGILKNVFML